MKSGKELLKKLAALAASVMLVLITALIGLPSAFANGGSILQIATIPADGEKMDAEYEFIAKYIEGVTTVETFGSGWKEITTKFTSSDFRDSYGIIPEESQKEQIGVIYRNVGMYGQKAIDLKITVMDWEGYVNKPSYITYLRTEISHVHDGYNYVDQVWEFVEAGTDNPVAVTGYMTINDIDYSQGIKFSNASSAAITKVYVSGTDNWIMFDDSGGEYYFYEDGNKGAKETDLFAMFTFCYRNQSQIQFKWIRDHEAAGTSKNRVYPEDFADGDYFGFIARKPLETETAIPQKFVSDQDELLVTENTLTNRLEGFVYTVTHTVPDEWEEFYYNSYIFTDTIMECLDIEALKILNLSGEDVTSWFDIDITDNVINAAAKESCLSSRDFYYDTYRFEISVKIRGDADLSSYMNSGIYVLDNTASVSIDGDSAASDTVETKVPVRNEIPEIRKMIVTGAELVEEIKAEHQDAIVFHGTIAIPDAKVYSKIQFSDELHESLIYGNLTIYDAGDTDITDKGSIAVEENKITFTFAEEHLADLAGETLYFYLETTMDAGADFSDVPDGRVPNTYNLILDDDAYTSNEVFVEVEVRENRIIKSIIVDDAAEQFYMLQSNTEDIVFHGEIEIANIQKVKSIVLEDQLHEAFQYKRDSLKVYDAEGADITDNGTIESEGQTVRFAFDETYASGLAGRRITWELTVNYLEGSDLSELTDLAVPNVMQLFVNDEELHSNEVKVEPIPLENSIVKSIIDAGGNLVTSLKLNNNQETISFQGNVVVKNTSEIEKLVLKDAVSSKFVIDVDSVQVAKEDGADVTALGTVSVSSKNVLTYEAGGAEAQSLAGEHLSWRFDVTYDQDLDFTEDQSETNTMEVEINGETTESDEVQITPVTESVEKVKGVAPKSGDIMNLLSVAGMLLIGVCTLLSVSHSKRQ